MKIGSKWAKELINRVEFKIKITPKQADKFSNFMEEWINYRGGMGNRIDGFDVKDVMDYLKQEVSKNE